MRLIIRNAEAAHVDPASQPNRLNVNIEGIEVEDILNQINITEAINYYGITELFDMIGDEKVRSHLHNLKSEEKNEITLKATAYQR